MQNCKYNFQTGFPIIHSSAKKIAFPQTYSMEPNIIVLGCLKNILKKILSMSTHVCTLKYTDIKSGWTNSLM